MNNQVGYAPVESFGEKVALGTDGIGADMLEELRGAYFKARDAHVQWPPDRWMSVLAAGHRMASEVFGVPIGKLDKGSCADLVVLDYRSPTPLTDGNLASH
jgi:cytosine/adenosine deaminase-related metal-dependent hydrolase